MNNETESQAESSAGSCGVISESGELTVVEPIAAKQSEAAMATAKSLDDPHEVTGRAAEISTKETSALKLETTPADSSVTVSVKPVATGPCIMLIAGEASGDAHGAELISALRRQSPDLRYIGAGGPKMSAAGQEQLFDLSEHAVVGLVEVFRHYFKFRRFFERLRLLAERERPKALVLIDYPGFNTRFAKMVRKILPQTRIIYYISPQAWAWKERRIYAMQQYVDLMLAIFPFEKGWYEERVPKFPVLWVGHPLLDRIDLRAIREPHAGRIALLPGSRRAEIQRHLPVMWETARLLAQRLPNLRFVLICPNEERRAQAEEIIARHPAPNFEWEIFTSYQLSHLSRCQLALVASGTASLECAMLGVPPIVVYKTHPVTYQVAKSVIKLKHISMVNILADRPVVPELIQGECTPAKLAAAAQPLLEDEDKLRDLRRSISSVVASLGGAGASDRAARAVLVELTAAERKR